MDATLLDLRGKRIRVHQKKMWHPSQTVRDSWSRSASRSRQGLPALPIRGNHQKTISEEKSPKLYPIARLGPSERSGQVPQLTTWENGFRQPSISLRLGDETNGNWSSGYCQLD